MIRKLVTKRFAAGGPAFVAALVLAAGASGSWAQSAQGEVTEQFQQTYQLSPGGRVSLSNITGKVRVVGGSGNEVRVEAVKRARSAEALREAEIKVDASGNHVRIETDYPNHRLAGRQGSYNFDGREAARVDYVVSVPRGATLEDVSTVNGPIEIEGVSGAVRVSSVNGGISARGLAGTAKLSVVNGKLEATFDRLSEAQAITLNSVSGRIELVIPSDSNALIKANTVSGQITNDFNLPVKRGEYVGRSLAGQLGSGGPSIKLSNVSGAINIRHAADGRPVSPATNLLTGGATSGGHGGADDDDSAQLSEQINRDVRREMERVRPEIDRAKRDAQREAARAAARETRALAREEARAKRDAARVKNEPGRGAASHSPRLIERESNSFGVGASPSVRIETFDGPVRVHGWDQPEVRYVVVKRAADENEMRGIRVQARGAGSEVSIRADFDKSHAHGVVERGGHVVSYNSHASAEFEVYVPRDARVVVSSGDGSLRLEGVKGEIELRTGDGSVDVSRAGGRLRVSTGDGSIRVADFDGEADANTGDGRITLDGRFTKLTAKTGDGTISLAVPADANATVETTGGAVINGDGVAVAEDAGGESQGRTRRWKIGGGGSAYVLRTGDGQIILRRR